MYLTLLPVSVDTVNRGFGREGGKEGLYEYARRMETPPSVLPKKKSDKKPAGETPPMAIIDQTPKMYIGGKQVRPDGGYSRTIYSYRDGKPDQPIGEVGEGNRKDIRNAVEAAHKATSWTTTSAHNRAQVLYFIAENLSRRKTEFGKRLMHMISCTEDQAQKEVQQAIDCIFRYAALADKYDGQVHATPYHNVTFAMPDALGVMGIVCPKDFPLMGFLSTVMPAIAMGNRVVVIPSQGSSIVSDRFLSDPGYIRCSWWYCKYYYR